MRKSGRYSTAFVASAFCHAACLGVFAILSGAVADRRPDPATATKPAQVSRVVWVTGAQPSGGGGGGGDRSPRPATRLERRGSDLRSVPPAPNVQAAVLEEETRSVQRLDLPAVPTEHGLKDVPGAMVGVPDQAGISQGPGDGGGAGPGLGPGIGPGRGPGLGPRRGRPHGRRRPDGRRRSQPDSSPDRPASLHRRCDARAAPGCRRARCRRAARWRSGRDSSRQIARSNLRPGRAGD